MCTFSLPKWKACGQSGKGLKAREREGECFKRLSLRKHGVSLSSHVCNPLWSVWRTDGDKPKWHHVCICDSSTFSSISFFSSPLCLSPPFSISILSRAPCHCEQRHRYCSLYSCPPLVLSLTASLTPYLVVCPLIINVTPLIRSINPPLSGPLTPTSFTRGVRIKDGEQFGIKRR